MDTPDGSADRTRIGLRVEGTVQGVGFRPHVHALATGLRLGGHVGNDAAGLFMEVEGPRGAVERFVERLASEAPPLASVDAVRATTLPLAGTEGFTIVASSPGGGRTALVPPDVATCDACLAEIADPADRRYRYAFTNCTDCGPRFTIIRDIPYDRPATTMAGFAMCAECDREYRDPTDRRFHAQPVCCPACGPRLRLLDRDGTEVAGDPVERTAALLADGAVVAVKGLGGYHLAADARHADACRKLRDRKHREDKPFAVMVRDLDAARRLCRVSDVEAGLLTSAARPIVLVERRDDDPIAPAVGPGNRSLGVLLPYTPLHHLLLGAHGGPIVLTSGNVSDEPIAYRDDDALDRLGPLADAFLTHDRPIHVRTDDSVVRVVDGKVTPLRRSRGYVPRPVVVPWAFSRQVLAVGAQLKNTIAVARDQRVFVSHHVGDLENWETFRSFEEAVDHLTRLFDVEPALVAHDLHPEYLSTKYAHDLASELGVERVGIQHHHAHVASCLADNGREGPVIGVAFDGTGFGTDGTIWGGEVLVADLRDVERVAHLETVPLPGGAAAIAEPWRMAAAHLAAVYGDALPDGLAVRDRHADRWEAVLAAAQAGVNSPPTSSMGRLLDAVAAVLGVRDAVNYEGQAAIELEQRATGGGTGYPIGGYPIAVDDHDGSLVIRGAYLVRAVVDDLLGGAPVPVIADRVHHAVSAVTVEVCERVRGDSGLATVALSGGVFQNVLLVERTAAGLRERGFEVLTHGQVPPNDGGISLGQAVIAGARDRVR